MRGKKEISASVFRSLIKKVFFLQIKVNLFFALSPKVFNTWVLYFRSVVLMSWKKNILKNSVTTREELRDTMIFWRFREIETSMDLNHRFKDLAGLK